MGGGGEGVHSLYEHAVMHISVSTEAFRQLHPQDRKYPNKYKIRENHEKSTLWRWGGGKIKFMKQHQTGRRKKKVCIVYAK